MKELLLAKSLIFPAPKGRIQFSCVISLIGVAVGVAMFMLTLGVYDSYVRKLETIAFSVYPNILVLDKSGPTTKPEDVSQPFDPEREEKNRCDRICRGETVLGSEGGGASSSASMERLSDLQAVFRPIEGVTLVAPLILDERDFRCLFQRSGENRTEVRPLRILGVEPRRGEVSPRIDLFLDADLIDRLKDPESASVALSEEAAASFFDDAQAAGRQLTVLREGRSPLQLTVVGTFSLGFHTISRNLLITSIATAQELLGMGDQVSYFGVSLADPYVSGKTLERALPELNQASFAGSDWMSVASGDFHSIRLFRWIIFTVLGMSFLITGFNIRNTLTILTLERRKQTGILRALGLRDASLRGVFLLISVSIGLAGTALGLAAGSQASFYFGSWLDRKLMGFLPISGVDVALSKVAMFEVFLVVMATCVITALVSVQRALQLDPVKCLEAE